MPQLRFELEPDNRNVSDETLLSDLKKVATELGKGSVTIDEYNSKGRFNAQTLARRFGGWLNALAKAGLGKTKYMNILERELFANLERVWMILGRQPKYRELVPPLSKYAAHTYLSSPGQEVVRQCLTTCKRCANGATRGRAT